MDAQNFAVSMKLYWVEGEDDPDFPDLEDMDRYFRVRYGYVGVEWD
jgi:hypothetical protein